MADDPTRDGVVGPTNAYAPPSSVGGDAPAELATAGILRRAAPSRRAFARLIDLFVALILAIGCAVFVDVVCGVLTGLRAGNPALPWGDVLHSKVHPPYSDVLLVGLYLVMAEGLCGSTLGKAILGLCVLDSKYRPCGLPRALVRTALLPVDLVLAPFTYVLMVLRSRGQRIGDLVAGTTVVRVPARDSATRWRLTRVLALSLVFPGFLLGAATIVYRVLQTPR